jgi:hypothetical protein
MRRRRLVRSLLAAALPLALAPGCQAFHSYCPVGVLVRDAETTQPIPAAQVGIYYPAAPAATAPCESWGPTGPDGIARLRAAPSGPLGVTVTASATGYMPEEMNTGVETVGAIKSAGWFEHTERRPPEMVLELYSEPRFGVELVVPVGYRGLVKAELRVLDNAPCRPGQRCWRAEVPAFGAVQVQGPPVLRRIQPPDFKARFADGTPLGGHMDVLTVGFRWLKREGDVQCFVVGTQPEYDGYMRRLVQEESSAGSRSDGGKGQGRGGGRRRGGGQPSSQ